MAYDGEAVLTKGWEPSAQRKGEPFLLTKGEEAKGGHWLVMTASRLIFSHVSEERAIEPCSLYLFGMMTSLGHRHEISV